MECAVFVLLRLDRLTWHNVKPPPVCPRVRGAFLFRQDAARCSDGPQCVHSFLCRRTAGFPPLIVNNGAMTWVDNHLSQTLLLGVHAREVELLDRVVIAFNSLRSSPSCASDFQAQRWPRELRRREPRPPCRPRTVSRPAAVEGVAVATLRPVSGSRRRVADRKRRAFCSRGPLQPPWWATP